MRGRGFTRIRWAQIPSWRKFYKYPGGFTSILQFSNTRIFKMTEREIEWEDQEHLRRHQRDIREKMQIAKQSPKNKLN